MIVFSVSCVPYIDKIKKMLMIVPTKQRFTPAGWALAKK